MARKPEALLGDRIPLEDHIADDVVLTAGNGVMAMFEAAGVFSDTADDVDVSTWYDQLHNALKNIAAEDIELTIYQCRGEADRAIYAGGLHRSQFARGLDAAYRDNLFRGSLYSNRLFLAIQIHAPNVAVAKPLTVPRRRGHGPAGRDQRTEGPIERELRLVAIAARRVRLAQTWLRPARARHLR